MVYTIFTNKFKKKWVQILSDQTKYLNTLRTNMNFRKSILDYRLFIEDFLSFYIVPIFTQWYVHLRILCQYDAKLTLGTFLYVYRRAA